MLARAALDQSPLGLPDRADQLRQDTLVARLTGLGRSELIPGPGALQAMADLLAGRPVAAVPRLAEVVAAARHLPPEQLAVRFYAANMALLIGDFDSARDLLAGRLR